MDEDEEHLPVEMILQQLSMLKRFLFVLVIDKFSQHVQYKASCRVLLVSDIVDITHRTRLDGWRQTPKS